VSPKKSFGRRTVSLNPERQRSAIRRLEEHVSTWDKTIGYFKSRRLTEDGVLCGTTLLDQQGRFRRREMVEDDSYLELEQIYSRATGVTEAEKRHNFCNSVASSDRGLTELRPISAKSNFGQTEQNQPFVKSFARTQFNKTTRDFWQDPAVQR